MIATRLAIPDVVLSEPKVFGDERGFFLKASISSASKRQLAAESTLCKTTIRARPKECCAGCIARSMCQDNWQNQMDYL